MQSITYATAYARPSSNKWSSYSAPAEAFRSRKGSTSIIRKLTVDAIQHEIAEPALSHRFSSSRRGQYNSHIATREKHPSRARRSVRLLSPAASFFIFWNDGDAGGNLIFGLLIEDDTRQNGSGGRIPIAPFRAWWAPARNDFLESRARGGIFGAQDGRASINFRVLYQLIKA